MASENLQALVGTAIIDSQFRNNLLTDAAQATKEFDLSPEERLIVTNIHAKTFQSFAQQLHEWICDESAISLSRVSTAMNTH